MHFLRFAKDLSDEEKDIVGQSPENLSDYIKEKKPELADFKKQIDYFMEFYNECDEIENDKVFFQWLRINNKPFKQALLNTICKWTNVLKTHLVDRVNSRFVLIN